MNKQKIWTVSEVNGVVRELIENTMMPLWLQGEVGTLNIYRSGHVYLTLKDAKCQIRGVFFNGAAKARQMDLKVGAQVEVFGSLSVYEVRGEYQFVIRSLRPMGIGDLQRRFEELKERLRLEGLFDDQRKKPIPFLPRRIGVVSSPDGAAVRDFLQVINRRFPNINIKIYPAACQGKGAAKELAAGVRFFNRTGAVDVIVVTRGGGSIEDLWPFNEEILAREVAASVIPVVSAVGHEIDFTICDFVADLRVATPSAAAELVVGRQEEMLERIANLKRRLVSSVRFLTEKLGRRYENAARSYVFREPQRIIRERQQRLDELMRSMEYALKGRLESTVATVAQLNTRLLAVTPRTMIREREQRLGELQKNLAFLAQGKIAGCRAELAKLQAELQAISPTSVLQRGYALLTDEQGGIVRNPGLPEGTLLQALVAEGSMCVEVRNRQLPKD